MIILLDSEMFYCDDGIETLHCRVNSLCCYVGYRPANDLLDHRGYQRGLANRFCPEGGFTSFIETDEPGFDIMIAVSDGFVLRHDISSWSSRSATSAALYPAYCSLKHFNQPGGYLVQLLNAMKSAVVTSCHCHNETMERFYPISASEANVEIRLSSGNWMPLLFGQSIPCGCFHQLIPDALM